MKLYQVIRANSIFSSISGITIIIYREELGQLLEYQNNPLYLVIGVGLIIFGFSLGYLSTVSNPTKGITRTVVLLDLGWVAGSLVLILLPDLISIGGKVLVAGLGLIVLSLAIAQERLK